MRDAPARPRALREGDRVSIIAPASLASPERVAPGVRYLREHGLVPVVHPLVPRRPRYLAGTDLQRARALEDAFADPTTAAVFCAAGGYGSVRLLPLLDLAALARQPKIFLGFSDITALHVRLVERARLVTFHGPLAAMTLGRRIPPLTDRALWKALTSTSPLGELPAPRGAARPIAIVPGRARGRIIAGNISVLTSLLGTPMALDGTGALLFLEETSEHPCRLDEMLRQLRASGLFDRCAGMVIARLHRCRVRDAGFPFWNPLDVIAQALQGLRRPVLYGLEFGHTARMLTIPCGVMGEMQTSPPRVRVVEPALVAAGRNATGESGNGEPVNRRMGNRQTGEW